MVFLYSIMVICGIVMMGFGLWSVSCRTGRMEKTGAFLAPLGLLIALLGALLLCVPDFFFPS
jgi:hypothetical protein